MILKREMATGVAAIAAGAAFALNFTSSEYVQDGLTVQYDAIDNVGAGTHDASATQWIDLKGGMKFTLAAHGSWRDGIALYCDGSGQAAKAAGGTADSYAVGNTYEYVFKREVKSSTWSLIFYGRQGGAYGPFAGWCAGNSDGFVFSHYAGCKITAGQFAVASCVYNQDATTKKVVSGKTMLLNATTAPSGGGAGNLNASCFATLGAKDDGGWPYQGDIYAIRIYSRSLTDAETVLNAGLDRVRFNGESAAVAFAPKAGYSYQDGNFCLDQIAFTGGGGTVAVKNSGEASLRVTNATPYQGSVTFVATPASGYVFTSWIGSGLTDEQRTNPELTVCANALATYEAAFECNGGDPWWTAGTMTWSGSGTEQVGWYDYVGNWWDSTAKAHRFPASGDVAVFSANTAYNVLITSDAIPPVKSVQQNGGVDGGFANTVTLGSGVSMTVNGWVLSEMNSSGGGRVRRLVLDGAQVTDSGRTKIGSSGNTRSELILTNGAVMLAYDLIASNSSGSWYGGTGIVEVVDGTLYKSVNTGGRFNLCVGNTTDDDSWTKNSYARLYIGKKGHVRVPYCEMLRNVDFILDGGEFNLDNSPGQSSSPYFSLGTTASGMITVRVKDGLFRLPMTPTVNGHYGNERLSRIHFEGAGQMAFYQEGGIVTNCGIWFCQQTGAVPPRYEISGGEMYMISAVHNGDLAAGRGDGIAANGIAVGASAANGGTFCVKGGGLKVSVPRINTELTSGSSNDDGGNKTYTTTEYRPHIETVITKTGASTIELRKTTEVRGMHTVIPEGGLQVVTNTRFAVWRHATGETLVPQTSETYFRAPNAALWDSGVFSDRPDEWGVTLKTSAMIQPGQTLTTGVAAGWMALPADRAQTLRRARVLLKLEPQSPYTLDDIAADLAAAGYEAEKISGDYNLAVSVLSMLETRADRRLIFDFNAVQDAVDVRDNVLTPKALLVKAETDYMSCGMMLIVR